MLCLGGRMKTHPKLNQSWPREGRSQKCSKKNLALGGCVIIFLTAYLRTYVFVIHSNQNNKQASLGTYVEQKQLFFKSFNIPGRHAVR
jgi:hypothetical protein